MIQYNEQKAHSASDSEFAEIQKQWLLDYVSQELSWQFVECHLRRFDFIMEAELRQAHSLRVSGAISIDNDKISNLKKKYLELRNIWRDPGLFKIENNNFQEAHDRLCKQEKKLKITNKGNHLSIPDSRAQASRNDIKEMSDTAVFQVIKDRYKIRCGRGGVKKFEDFVESKILSDKNLCNFFFGGKGKPPEYFDEFKKIRTNSRRNLRKSREKNPIYQRMFKTQALIWSVNLRKSE